MSLQKKESRAYLRGSKGHFLGSSTVRESLDPTTGKQIYSASITLPRQIAEDMPSFSVSNRSLTSVLLSELPALMDGDALIVRLKLQFITLP